jgi:hypothetical protein
MKNDDEDFNKRLNEADKIIHPVETQWHYPILTKYGFMPVTKTSQGIVRRYEYVKSDKRIVCCTGMNADYWTTKGGFGYCTTLEEYLKSL